MPRRAADSEREKCEKYSIIEEYDQDWTLESSGGNCKAQAVDKCVDAALAGAKFCQEKVEAIAEESGHMESEKVKDKSDGAKEDAILRVLEAMDDEALSAMRAMDD